MLSISVSNHVQISNNLHVIYIERDIYLATFTYILLLLMCTDTPCPTSQMLQALQHNPVLLITYAPSQFYFVAYLKSRHQAG
ncbi:hypothetical protein FKM82_008404 [Ascaphus truei]